MTNIKGAPIFKIARPDKSKRGLMHCFRPGRYVVGVQLDGKYIDCLETGSEWPPQWVLPWEILPMNREASTMLAIAESFL